MPHHRTGRYDITSHSGETVQAFIPNPLPPRGKLDIVRLQKLIDGALVAIGRLDSVTAILPDPALYLSSFIRKEAVLSSRIEGTASSLSDVLLYELNSLGNRSNDDVIEVSNYAKALEHGMERMAKENFPLSNRLIKEIHAILLKSGRGGRKSPGEFRTSQNWIGGTRPGNAHFVPPPPQHVGQCMSDLERFIHSDQSQYSALIKAGLTHAQFETIHPFLDE